MKIRILETSDLHGFVLPTNFTEREMNLPFSMAKAKSKIDELTAVAQEQGEIIVKIETVDNQVQFSVKDFGIGMPEDKKDKVFEQYYRVSGDEQTVFPGLGLGLYISSQIIERSKGKIWVNSVLDKGSTFYFSLPKLINS